MTVLRVGKASMTVKWTENADTVNNLIWKVCIFIGQQVRRAMWEGRTAETGT